MGGSDFVNRDQRIMTSAVNYNNWIFNTYNPFLGKKILEIGAGIGNMSIKILNNKNVEELTINELEQSCVDEHEKNIAQNIPGKKINYFVGDFLDIDFNDHAYDSIVCINVLEHISDDNLALKKFYNLLLPKGFLILFIPAFNLLLGEIDKKLGHFRRYRKNPLKKQLQNIGYKIIEMRYYNFVGFWGWLVNFKMLKRDSQSYQQVKIFDKYIFPVQAKIEKYMPWQSIGQNMLVVLQKNNFNGCGCPGNGTLFLSQP